VPKLSSLVIEGRIAAYNAAINGIKVRQNDPFFRELDLHETKVELKGFVEKLVKERDKFILSQD